VKHLLPTVDDAALRNDAGRSPPGTERLWRAWATRYSVEESMPPAPRQLLTTEASRAGLTLDALTLAQLERYVDLLVTWGLRMNLVSCPEPATVIERHLPDAFFLAATLRALDPATGIDVGSGGGLPAVPLSVLLPDLELDLVEPSRRKCAFLRTVCHDLSLPLRVHASRLEQLLLPPRDVAMSRATWSPETWLERAPSLVRDGGWIVVFLARAEAAPPVPEEVLELRRTSYVLADGTPRLLLVYTRTGLRPRTRAGMT
jgi:16S rRNA (guanine527-N7)-methyltransferase